MLRRILIGMALTGAALIPAMPTAPVDAAEGHPASAEAAYRYITRDQCIRGGGRVRYDRTSPTHVRCYGGLYHGFPTE
jgi:hypothetical protein